MLTDVTADNEAYTEELFGAIAQVYRVGSEEEAVRLANYRRFGLGSDLFTTDPEQAERVANKIEAGMVYVNVVAAQGAELPFGGVKSSGFGRELGRHGRQQEAEPNRRTAHDPAWFVTCPDHTRRGRA